MAKTDKKVSIALFDEIMKEQFEYKTTIQWHGAEVSVKCILSLADMLAFVDDVVKSCFHDKLGFMPEVMDFAIKSNILTRYANFSMPDNLEHRYQMIYATDAVDAVCAAISEVQLQEIVNAINSKIDFLCDSKATAIEARVNDVLTAMEEIRDKTQDIFAGLTRDDVKKVMDAIGNGSVSEEKIVQAYLEQTNGETIEGEVPEPAMLLSKTPVTDEH